MVISNILLEFDSFFVSLYSLSYLLSFVVVYFVGLFALKYQNHINKRIFFNMCIIISFSSILGGRIAHIFLYNYQYYKENPLQVFHLENGGMSSFGAFLFSFIFMYIYSKKVNVKFSNFSDIAFLLTPICIFFIRIANFINNEIPMKKTSYLLVPLFESLFEGLFLFLFLFFIFKNKPRKFVVTFLFLYIYSFLRIFFEYFKNEANLHLFNMSLNVSQVLYVGLVIILFFIQKTYKMPTYSVYK